MCIYKTLYLIHGKNFESQVIHRPIQTISQYPTAFKMQYLHLEPVAMLWYMFLDCFHACHLTHISLMTEYL